MNEDTGHPPLTGFQRTLPAFLCPPTHSQTQLCTHSPSPTQVHDVYTHVHTQCVRCLHTLTHSAAPRGVHHFPVSRTAGSEQGQLSHRYKAWDVWLRPLIKHAKLGPYPVWTLDCPWGLV